MYPAIGSPDALGALQLNSTWCGAPVPLRGIEPVETLVATVSCPLYVPAVVGSNCTCSVSDWPGLSVVGNVAPETENPVPVTDAEFNVSGAVPVEVIVKDCATGVFTITLPKPIDVALILMAAAPVAGAREIVNVFEMPLSFAVMTALCAVVTLATLAEKPLLAAFRLTVIWLGTVTAGLLLESAM